MQHRRPHSAIAESNGSATGNGIASSSSQSFEERRRERRLAKERRGGAATTSGTAGTKRLRRVKRSDKYGASSRPLAWNDVRLGLYSFGMFSFVCMTGFRIFRGPGGHHRSSGSGSGDRSSSHRNLDEPEAGEYNSDNAGGSLLSRLRGESKYVIPESMKRLGNKAKWYAELREEYDTDILPKDDERSLKFVEAERERQGRYDQSPDARTPYDIHDCPEHPPEGYPVQWPILEVLENWPTDEANPQKHREIYQGLCVFDFRTELHKANNYRHKEVPFVVRDDPAVARASERWNHPGYMERLLMGKEDIMRRAEYSPNNHFMFWIDKRPREERRAAMRDLRERKRAGENVHAGFGRGDQVAMKEAKRELERFNDLKEKLADAKDYLEEHEDDDEAQEEVQVLQEQVNEAKRKQKEKVAETWQPPTENIRMTYVDWLLHANVTDDQLGPDNPHWYFRLIGCGSMGHNTEDGSCDKGSSEWLFDELTFFQPREGGERPFYMIEPRQQKGIHCRFGMKGVIAENHFDLSRNAIALLAGRRRYILAHPNQCNSMNLLPRGHPSARHSAVDWSDPDLENFPTFPKAHVNEVVMQPGDVLYLPTNWFHYIVSLELNMQCNTRSGGEHLYRQEINDCGF